MGEAEKSGAADGSAAFESLVSLLDYPMFVVTTAAGAPVSTTEAT